MPSSPDWLPRASDAAREMVAGFFRTEKPPESYFPGGFRAFAALSSA